MMKKKIIATGLLMLCAAIALQARKKQDVSVLYVGGSADIETVGAEVLPDQAVLDKSAAGRAASFESLLKEHFKKVKVVNAKDYTYKMSDGYDVTILDGKPEPIVPGIYDCGDNGEVIRYERPGFFPLNFDRPVITIANFGDELGRRTGTKNDWYCLCLENYALGWNAEHPIFKGPLKVNPVVELKPTPEPALSVAEMMGEELSATTPMFLMQDVNYETDRNYRIGMVTRPGGYLDSPETEVISGGKCAKSIDAIAIGRHANWMTWGFSASPAHMTDAAKAMFVNAIVYMKQFSGQHPVAHKFNDGVATRDHIAMWKYLTSREGWESNCKSIVEFNNMMHAMKDSLNAVLAAGGQIDPNLAVYLQIPEQEVPSYRDFIKQNAGDLYAVFGEDAAEYARYYDKNYGYFHCPPGEYRLELDQDARYLGIANNDKALLDKCISILEEGKADTEEADNILRRYTLCRFDTPAQWRSWFETYKDKLFFTESGGYLWLVDTFEDVPGNDYNVWLNERETEYAASSGMRPSEGADATTDMEPVYLAAKAVKTGRGTTDIVVYQEIHAGYHTYAVVPSDLSFVQTSVIVELPEGYQTQGRLYTPGASPLDGSGTLIYTGAGEFRQTIAGEGGGDAVVTVRYQCCNDNGCLIPQTKKFTVKL